MVFQTLPTSMQDALLMNYNQSGKLFLIFIILAGSFYYRLYSKPYNQKETIFISVGIIRLLWDQLSLVLIFTTPFFFLFMSPEYLLWEFATLVVTVITLALLLFLTFLGIDIFNIGLIGVVSKMGANIDPATARFFNKITKWRRN